MTDVITILVAASANVTGPSFDTGDLKSGLTLETTTTGSVSAFSVQLQGSLDSVSWVALGSPQATVTTAAVSTAVLARYFRAVLSGLTGSGTVTAKLGFTAGGGYTGGSAVSQSAMPASSVALIGDSITNYNAQPGYPITYNTGYWIWANEYLGHRAVPVFMDGVFGSGCTDSTWPQRVQNLIASGASLAIIEIGTNDIARTSPTFAGVVNGTGFTAGCGLAATIAALRAARMTVVMHTIPPRTNNGVALPTGNIQVHDQVNAWIRGQTALAGVYVCDVASTFTDPLLGSGQWAGLALGNLATQITTGATSVTIALPGTLASAGLASGLAAGSYVRLLSGTTAQYFQVQAAGSSATSLTALNTAQAAATTFTTAATAVTYSQYSLEGVHPNVEGARQWGIALAATLAPLLPQSSMIMPAGDTWNLLEPAYATFQATASMGLGGTGAGFPATLTNGTWYWTTVPGGGSFGPTVTQVARTDGIPGYWTQFTVPAGQVAVLRGYLTSAGARVQNVASLYSGASLVAYLEMQASSLESPASIPATASGVGTSVVIDLPGSAVPNALQATEGFGLHSDPGAPYPLSVLQTPRYLGSNLGILSGTYTQGTAYASVTIALFTSADIPAGTVLLVQDEGGNGQFITTTADTPANINGATTVIPANWTAAVSYTGSGGNPSALYRTAVQAIPPVPVSLYTLTSATALAYTGTPPTAGTTLTAGTAAFTGTATVSSVTITNEYGGTAVVAVTGGSFTSPGTVTPASVTNSNRYIRITFNGGGTYQLGRVGILRVQ